VSTQQGGASPGTVLAVLLAVATAVFALRAVGYEPEAAPAGGLFGPEGAPQAEELVLRLCRGLVARQQEDGGFDPGEYTYDVERVAGSALVAAAFAEIHRRGWAPRVEGLTSSLARGLDFLKRRQSKTGPIGQEEREDYWSQVDGTSAGVLALAVAGREEDAEALALAAGALQRFARAKLRNGWTRGLGVMVAARLDDLGLGKVLGGDPTRLADFRQIDKAPNDGLLQTGDWNVAEAISRVVLGLKKGVDPFPGRMVEAVLGETPEWNYPSSDCAAWWMHAWLVARSGSEKAPAWFATLRSMLAEEAVGKDDVIQGGYYENTLAQSAGAIFAVLEGLDAEVLVE